MEENVELKTVSYDELEFPDTLYKYRTWNEAKHKTIISHRQVYMSAPFDFKDPLDCKNQIRYDLLTPMEIFLKYYLDHKKENPHLSHIELSKFAAYWYNKSPVRDKEHIKKLQEEDFIKYNNRTGILSLSYNPVRLEMWEKYSANHTGICVGFNPKTMFKYHRGGGGKVFYCSELPIIKPTPWESFEVQMIKQLYSKLDKWSFEEEYRADIFNYNPLTKEDRIVTLPPETYREIIFGAKISNENKKDIIAIAKQTMPHIVFKQANFTNNNGIELTPCTNL